MLTRTNYHIAQTLEGKIFCGFLNNHENINLEFCPIQYCTSAIHKNFIHGTAKFTIHKNI